MKSLALKGKEIWIIGGGNSIVHQFGIPQEVVEKVKSKQLPMSAYSEYMRDLHDKLIIGVNVAYLLGDWVDILFFGDEKFWRLNEQDIKENYKGLVVSCSKSFERVPDNRVIYFPKDRNKIKGITNKEGYLSWNYNSGGAAINLAVSMGAKKIYLLGFDMKTSETSHFHGEYKQPDPNYNLYLRTFDDIKKDAEYMGVEIINVNSDSSIVSFPQQELYEVLDKEKPIEVNTDEVKIGGVTPTRSKERKQFLELTLSQMKRQTRPLDYHVVIDYPNETNEIDLVPRYEKGIQQCIDEGCDLIFLIEDDDFYPDTYIEEMTKKWIENGKPDIIGSYITIYYHLFSKYHTEYDTRKNKHSSAHCTAISKNANFRENRKDLIWYDIFLWRKNEGVLVYLKNNVISIKHGIGLCGGRGHDLTCSNDYDYSFLKNHVNEDAFKVYMNIVNKKRKDWKNIFIDKPPFSYIIEPHNLSVISNIPIKSNLIFNNPFFFEDYLDEIVKKAPKGIKLIFVALSKDIRKYPFTIQDVKTIETEKGIFFLFHAVNY